MLANQSLDRSSVVQRTRAKTPKTWTIPENIVLQQHPNSLLPFHQKAPPLRQPTIQSFLKTYKHLAVRQVKLHL
jgi:hypothetical protein